MVAPGAATPRSAQKAAPARPPSTLPRLRPSKNPPRSLKMAQSSRPRARGILLAALLLAAAAASVAQMLESVDEETYAIPLYPSWDGEEEELYYISTADPVPVDGACARPPPVPAGPEHVSPNAAAAAAGLLAVCAVLPWVLRCASAAVLGAYVAWEGGRAEVW